MSAKNLIFLIYISVLIRIFSANLLPKIDLFEGYGINPDIIKHSRVLETDPLQSSVLQQTVAVQVDLGDLYSIKTDFLAKNDTYLTITISSNETAFFAEDDYFRLNCDLPYCHLDNSTTPHRSLWAIGDAGRIFLKTPISIASGAWKLTTSALYFPTLPFKTTALGVHSVGWIGLGTGSEARNNFQTENPIFSIAYDAKSDTGNLIFGFNSSLADTSRPAITLSTNSNWEMKLVSVSIGDESLDFENNTAVFNLMSHDIGLPKEIAAGIISQLEKQGLDCVILVACTSTTLEGLLPLVFTFSDNTQFSVSPEVYMKAYEIDSDFVKFSTMNLMHARLAHYSVDYVTFGRNILANYYAVFQQMDQTNTITLYSPAHNASNSEQMLSSNSNSKQFDIPTSEVSSSSENPSNWIFLIVLIFVVVVLLGLVFIKRIPFQIKKLIQYRAVQVELQESDASGISIHPNT